MKKKKKKKVHQHEGLVLCPGDVFISCLFCTVQKLILFSHKSSSIRVELNHFLQVLPDIWEALQRLLKVFTGQREAAAISQGFHRGQMFAFGQNARLCWTQTHTHTQKPTNERVNSNDGDEI